MFVEDYMTPDPVTVHEEGLVDHARRLMQRHGFRQLPVLDSAARLVGIITDRDTRQAEGFAKPLRENLVVAGLMTADPITIPVNATLDEAVGLLAKHVRCVARRSMRAARRNHHLPGCSARACQRLWA